MPFSGGVLIALLSAQVLGGAAYASSDEAATTGPQEEQQRDFDQSELWVPSVSVAVSVHDEQLDFVAQNPIAFGFASRESATLASLRFGLDLMSPTFDDLPLEPRLFVSAGVLWSTPGNGLDRSNHATRTVDDYRQINLPALLRSYDGQEVSDPSTASARVASDFEGQGNSISGRQRHNAWYFGIGSVFTFPRSGFTLRVRPSIEYVGEQFDNKGEFTLLSDVDPLNLDPATSRFEINQIDLESRQTNHSLGPGLELEIVNHLEGSITLSFFTQARFLWIVDEPGIRMTGTTHDGSEVVYEVERQRFNFRGGAGFRLGFQNLAFGR